MGQLPTIHGYVFDHYARFRTRDESIATSHFHARMKGNQHRWERVRKDHPLTPQASELLKLDWREFVKLVGERILRDHKDQLYLNTCPRCDGIARTHHARQCPHCYHSWHDDKARNLLVVLDLDETLIHATPNSIGRLPDFRVDELYVYKRPGLNEFIQRVKKRHRVAIWSASSMSYIEPVLKGARLDLELFDFIWDNKRCSVTRDMESGEYIWEKRLRKLTKQGYSMDRMLLADNTPAKARSNYGNLIPIRSWTGDPTDRELDFLAPYIEELDVTPNLRRVEKRGWQLRFEEQRKRIERRNR